MRLTSVGLACLLAIAASAPFAHAESAATQVYLQRTSDGRAVLTDHPSSVAVTERTWKLAPEDPAAARQRAADVRAEAQAISERIQRSIDSQQRLADAGYGRGAGRLDGRRFDAYDPYDDDVWLPIAPYYGVGYGYGYGRHRGYGRSPYGPGLNDTNYQPPRVGAPSSMSGLGRGGRLSGSTTLGSR